MSTKCWRKTAHNRRKSITPTFPEPSAEPKPRTALPITCSLISRFIEAQIRWLGYSTHDWWDHTYGSARVPDLPGCVATGSTVTETEQAIREAIALHIEGLRECGSPIPPASSQVEYVEVAA